YRPRSRRAGRKYRAVCQGSSGQQCPAVGRPRHGKVLARQSYPRGRQCRLGQRKKRAATQTEREPPGRHRQSPSPDAEDTTYKSLKAVLEGGIEGRPDNVIFYATSNRRHLMSRDMMENERSTAINPGETVEEKVSLSDRFGLWLGFHRCSQDEYLAMVDGY